MTKKLLFASLASSCFLSGADSTSIPQRPPRRVITYRRAPELPRAAELPTETPTRGPRTVVLPSSVTASNDQEPPPIHPRTTTAKITDPHSVFGTKDYYTTIVTGEIPTRGPDTAAVQPRPNSNLSRPEQQKERPEERHITFVTQPTEITERTEITEWVDLQPDPE